MLPELLDNNAEYKVNVSPPVSVEALQSLRSWLEKKENESNRQARPAWIDVVWALTVLVEQQLDEGRPVEERLDKGALKSEQFAFETHIIARQVAKQRRERQLPTRFVTDEIKRIGNHQIDLLSQVDSDEILAVIGWYGFVKRRRLGLAIMKANDALSLSRNELGDESQFEIAQGTCQSDSNVNSTTNKGIANSKPATLSPLSFLFGVVLAIAFGIVVGIVFTHSQNENSRSVSTLESILKSKTMRCGVDGLLTHFSLRNDAEQIWWGLDVELCRTLGAALDVDVEFVKVSASQFDKRIQALFDRDVHILFRNTSHTAMRDLNNDIVFGPNYFYEQEYFLDLSPIANSDAIDNGSIKGKNICVKPGTSNEAALQYLKSDVDFNIITQNNLGEELTDNIKLLRALRRDNFLCDYVYGNYFVLKQLKVDQERRNPAKMLALRPYEYVSFDPLAPVLLRDYQWQTVVNYTIYALLYAEKLNINSYNVDSKYRAGNAIEQQFLRGQEIEGSGLTKDWVYRIISKVGNYSEIYYRAIVCDYVACDTLSEKEFYDIMRRIDKSRWPNKLFRADDPRPGLLFTPRF